MGKVNIDSVKVRAYGSEIFTEVYMFDKVGVLYDVVQDTNRRKSLHYGTQGELGSDSMTHPLLCTQRSSPIDQTMGPYFGKLGHHPGAQQRTSRL